MGFMNVIFIQHKMLYTRTLLFTFYNSCQCGVVEVICDFSAWSRVQTACVCREARPGTVDREHILDILFNWDVYFSTKLRKC